MVPTHRRRVITVISRWYYHAHLNLPAWCGRAWFLRYPLKEARHRMAAIVYHAPFPLDREASSASGIRPVRMLDAFRELGYTVLDVTGSPRGGGPPPPRQ